VSSTFFGQLHRCPSLPLLLVAATFLFITANPPTLAAQTGQQTQVASGSAEVPLPSEEQWGAQAVNSIRGQDILRAVFPETLPASAPVTRAKFAALMQRVFVLEPPSHPVQPADVAGVSRPELRSILALAPYLSPARASKAPFLFRPDAAVTREDAAAAAVRLISKFTAAKVLSAGESENALRRMSDKSDLSPSLRPFVATAVHLGILNPRTGGRLELGSALTVGDAEKAIAVLENDVLSTRAMPCPLVERPLPRAVEPKIIELEATRAVNPSLADMCGARADLFNGGVMLLEGASAPEFAALTGRSIPPVSAEARIFTVPEADKRGSVTGKVSTQLLPLTRSFFGVYAPSGQAPQVYEGFATAKGPKGGHDNLENWAQEVVKNASADPACNVAATGGVGSTATSGWTCYVEVPGTINLNSDATAGTPFPNSWGLYTFTADALRMDNSPPSSTGNYLIVGSWLSNPGGTCATYNYPFVPTADETCGPYVTDLAVSIPVATADTSSSPSLNGPSWCSGCMYSMGPATTQGSTSTTVSDTVGATGGVSASGGTAGISTTAGFSQSWSLPDIVTTVNAPGPGYPPNTASWVEQFTSPSYGWTYQHPPPLDAMRCTGCTPTPNFAAAFAVPDSSGPFMAEADGAGSVKYDQIKWLPASPLPILFALGPWIPFASSAVAFLNVTTTSTLQPPEFDVCWGPILVGQGTCISTQQPTGSLQIPSGGTFGVVVWAMEEGYQTPLGWTTTSVPTNSVTMNPCGVQFNPTQAIGTQPTDCNGVTVSSILYPIPGLALVTLSVSPSVQAGTTAQVFFDLQPPGLADSNLQLNVTVTEPPGTPLPWLPPFRRQKCPTKWITNSWCEP